MTTPDRTDVGTYPSADVVVGLIDEALAAHRDGSQPLPDRVSMLLGWVRGRLEADGVQMQMLWDRIDGALEVLRGDDEP